MKRAYIIYIFMLCVTQIFAQQTSEERIKSIKGNPEYLYSESKGESWGETEDSARKLLEEKITKYLTQNKMSIDPVVIENTAGNADMIELDNENEAYIFCYLHIKEISSDYLITDKVIEEEINPTPSTGTEETKPTDEPVKKKMEPQNSDALASIIRTENAEELNHLLFKLKDQHVIIYGRIKYMTVPEKSYILIFNEKKEKVAILDKGIDVRKNLLTGQADDKISNYKGMRAIWFQLFE